MRTEKQIGSHKIIIIIPKGGIQSKPKVRPQPTSCCLSFSILIPFCVDSDVCLVLLIQMLENVNRAGFDALTFILSSVICELSNLRFHTVWKLLLFFASLRKSRGKTSLDRHGIGCAFPRCRCIVRTRHGEQSKIPLFPIWSTIYWLLNNNSYRN